MSQERLRKELRRRAPQRRSSPSRDHAQSSCEEERGSWNTERTEEWEESERDNDEIPFSSAEPVVALGLTRLRLMEQEKEERRTEGTRNKGTRNKETRIRRWARSWKSNSAEKDEDAKHSDK